MTRFMHHRRRAALGGGLLALTALLAACGEDAAGEGTPASASSPTGTPASGPHNAADVEFATGMVPHHGQAIAMAELARTRASSAEVKDLAADIKAAQGPEIAQLSGWLAGWGEEVPDPDSMAMGMDHSGHGSGMGGDGAAGMAGMMSAEQMSELMTASGASFDRMWLIGMIAHHEGAIEMAEVELAEGENPDAQELARAIIEAQRAEIETMRDLLAG